MHISLNCWFSYGKLRKLVQLVVVVVGRHRRHGLVWAVVVVAASAAVFDNVGWAARRVSDP